MVPGWVQCQINLDLGDISMNWYNLQLSKSSRAIFGGAYFSDVSGWKSIPISVPGPCEVTESYRLLGFCLTYSFILSHTFTLDQCRVSRRFNSISPKTAKMDFSSVKFWISFCAGLVSTITSVTNNDDNTSIKWVSEGFSQPGQDGFVIRAVLNIFVHLSY